MNEEISIKLNVDVDSSEIDKLIKKMEKLIALQEEYNQLIKN